MKKLISLFLIPAVLSAYQIVSNGGFEKLRKDSNLPTGWYLNTNANTTVTMAADTANVHSGKNALKIDVTATPVKDSTNSLNFWHWFPKPLEAPATCNISLALCAVDVKSAYLVLQTHDKDKKVLIWKNFKMLSGSFGWQTITAAIDVPAGSARLNLSIRLTSTGTLWADDVSIDIAAAEKAPESQTFDFAGAILPETGLPAQWQKKEYNGNENVSTTAVKTEDGKTFAEQAWKTGAAHAGFTAKLPDTWLKYKAIQLTATLRTLDDGKADIGLEYFDKNGKSLGEAMAKDIASEKWSSVSYNFAPPSNAASAAIILNNTGMGTVQFAEARLSLGLLEKAIPLGAPALKVSVYPVKHSREQQGVKDPEFNTFTNSPTKLTFHFSGDRKRMVKPTLCIDVPDCVSIPAAICTHPNCWCEESFTQQPIKRPEGNYVRYTFVRVRAMQLAYPEERYQRRLDVLFTPVKPGDTFSNKKVFYHLENDGIPMAEDWFYLNVLPPMPQTPNPKKFVFWRWNDEDFTWPGDDLFLSTLVCQEEAGYTAISRYGSSCASRMKEVREIAKKRGWTLVTRAGIGVTNPGAFSKLEKDTGHKVEYSIKADGSVYEGRLCPSFLSDNPDIAEYRNNIFRADLKSRGSQPGEYLLLDSEEWSPMDWCFCDRCRASFAKINNISPVPDTATIKKNYPAQWRDFRSGLAAKIIKWHSEIAKEFKLKVGDYNYVNDYSKPNYLDRYYSIAKNTLINEPYQDLNLISYYHYHDAQAFDMHAIERKYLKKDIVPICAVDGVCSYLSRSEVLTPERFRLMMLGAAVNGSDGYAIYPGERMDAKFYIAGDKAMAEIAAVEDVLHDGKILDSIAVKPLPLKENTVSAGGKSITIAIPKWSDCFRSIVRELDGRKVIALLNYSTKDEAFVRITLDKPLNGQNICEHTTHQSLALPKGTQSFLVRIPTRDAYLLEVSASAPSDWPEYPRQEDLQKSFDALVAAANAMGGAEMPKAWKKDSCEFSYSLDDHGAPVPVLSSANQTIAVNTAYGASISLWRVDGIDLCSDGNWLSRNRLWTPIEAKGDDGKGRPAAIIAADTTPDGAYMTVENTFKDIAITQTKTFSLPKNGTSLNVKVTFRNDCDKTITLTGWTHNLINPEKLENSLDDGNVEYSLAGKKLMLPRTLQTIRLESPLFSKLPDDKRGFDATFKTDEIPVRQLYTKMNKAILYTPDAKHISSYSCYNSVKASTVEWMYGAVTLPPGKSVTFDENYALAPLK